MPGIINYSCKKLNSFYPSSTEPTPTIAIRLVQGVYLAGQAVEESIQRGIYQTLSADANAQLLLEYPIVVNAQGQHFMGDSEFSDEDGVGDFYTSAFAPGGALTFSIRDLSKDNAGTPITPAIISALKAVIISGNAADGILQF